MTIDFAIYIYKLYLCLNVEIRCVRALCLWRNSSSEVNDELFKGYREGNLEKKINEFAAGKIFLTCFHGVKIVFWEAILIK